MKRASGMHVGSRNGSLQVAHEYDQLFEQVQWAAEHFRKTLEKRMVEETALIQRSATKGFPKVKFSRETLASMHLVRLIRMNMTVAISNIYACYLRQIQDWTGYDENQDPNDQHPCWKIFLMQIEWHHPMKLSSFVIDRLIRKKRTLVFASLEQRQ